MDILIGALIALAVTIVGGILLFYFQSNIMDRLRVRQIKSPSDRYADAVIELYENLFPEDDGSNYTSDELIQMMNYHYGSDRHVDVKNITLALIQKREAVGFLFCHFYPERKKAIISYFAVQSQSVGVRTFGTTVLINALKKKLSSTNKCEIVFFEIQDFRTTPRSTNARTKKPRNNGDPESKYRGFRQKAKKLDLETREFKFTYVSPKVSLSADAKETPSTLFGVGISKVIPDQITKEEILEYLRFIYHDCYGDLYGTADPRFYKYHQHLETVLTRYKKTLPAFIDAV